MIDISTQFLTGLATGIILGIIGTAIMVVALSEKEKKND